MRLPRIGRFLGTESQIEAAGTCGRGDVELSFNGDRVSAGEDKTVPGVDDGVIAQHCRCPQCHLKMVRIVNFMLRTFYYKKKRRAKAAGGEFMVFLLSPSRPHL